MPALTADFKLSATGPDQHAVPLMRVDATEGSGAFSVVPRVHQAVRPTAGGFDSADDQVMGNPRRQACSGDPCNGETVLAC